MRPPMNDGAILHGTSKTRLENHISLDHLGLQVCEKLGHTLYDCVVDHVETERPGHADHSIKGAGRGSTTGDDGLGRE